MDCENRQVRIVAGSFSGKIGYCIGRITTTTWYNVLVIDDNGQFIRLALYLNEFEEEHRIPVLIPRELGE